MLILKLKDPLTSLAWTIYIKLYKMSSYQTPGVLIVRVFNLNNYVCGYVDVEEQTYLR